MRKTGREKANWDDTSWTEHVNWNEVIDKIPLAITYGKGVPIIRKTVYMNQWHQHVMEQILHEAREYFRTETDLTRSVMNTGLVMYYNIFMKNKASLSADEAFFYQSIRECEKAWKASDMAEVVKHVVCENTRRKRRKILTNEKAQSLYLDTINRLPSKFKEEVLSILDEESKDNIISNVTFNKSVVKGES
jgi:hypothetical protein